MRFKRLTVALIGSLGLIGCGAQGPEPLKPRAFYGGAGGSSFNEAPLSSTDRPGQVAEPGSRRPAQPLAEGPKPGISEAVSDVVNPPEASLPTTVPSYVADTDTTRPSTQPALYTYLDIGSLLAEVNGKPIYNNKAIRKDAGLLRDAARIYPRDKFEIYARNLIAETQREFIHDELEVAAAERTLDSQDRQLAKQITRQWRDQQLNLYGGSVQLAERHAEAEGKTFAEEEDEQERSILVQLYIQRKEEPRVQITQDDMWQFYQSHLNDPDLKFSQKDSAEIQLILKDPSREDPTDLAHGRTMALDEITHLHDQAARGADFSGLMGQSDMKIKTMPISNDSSFKFKNVNAAVWKLEPGQVSDVIEDTGGFFIVKVVSRVKGNVQPFDDQTVQDKIQHILRNEQLRKIRDEENIKLASEAVIRADADMVDRCVALAMQNYATWSKGK